MLYSKQWFRLINWFVYNCFKHCSVDNKLTWKSNTGSNKISNANKGQMSISVGNTPSG